MSRLFGIRVHGKQAREKGLQTRALAFLPVDSLWSAHEGRRGRNYECSLVGEVRKWCGVDEGSRW